ncbi:hypothetical protein AgCh_016281 [Apium graveolens]
MYKLMNSGRGQKKRNLTIDEDRALIETLQEVAFDTNWKNEKGWRDGYLVGMKANPHIESRWEYLKRKYNVIADMRGSSGFG